MPIRCGWGLSISAMRVIVFGALSEEELVRQAKGELSTIGIVDADQVMDQVVIRMPKAYPAYFGSYAELPQVIDHLNEIPNLYLVGRNGMHKYNNQDHSMLAAMTAVENIKAGRVDKSNIWAINTEEEYHESRSN